MHVGKARSEAGGTSPAMRQALTQRQPPQRARAHAGRRRAVAGGGRADRARGCPRARRCRQGVRDLCAGHLPAGDRGCRRGADQARARQLGMDRPCRCPGLRRPAGDRGALAAFTAPPPACPLPAASAWPPIRRSRTTRLPRAGRSGRRDGFLSGLAGARPRGPRPRPFLPGALAWLAALASGRRAPARLRRLVGAAQMRSGLACRTRGGPRALPRVLAGDCSQGADDGAPRDGRIHPSATGPAE